MGVPAGMHHLVRAVTGWWPYLIPTYGVNLVLGWIGFDSKRPRWMRVRPRGELPGVVLNVSDRYHRKNFYFFKAYYRQIRMSRLARYLEQTLEPGGIFLDVGAHLGFYSFFAARLVGEDGHVHAFEPDPMSYVSITDSAKLNARNITAHAIALSDEPCRATLHRARAQAHSLVPFGANDPRCSGNHVTVEVTTLDAWSKAAQLDVSRVQVVKIDVEGAEPRSVAGSLDFVTRAGRPPVWCEVRGPLGSTRAPATYNPVREELAKIGYRPYRFDRGEPMPIVRDDVTGREDVLFLKEGR